MLEQFVIAEVHQHRRERVIHIHFMLGLGWAETRLQQTRAAGVLRRIWRNGCSAVATKSFRGVDSHRAAIPFTQVMHGNSQQVIWVKTLIHEFTRGLGHGFHHTN
ncbi:MAG: hypothetical protein DMF42_11215 [Verrucomicrobia bacterium]|nr:MAG: hypothetical protein DMF42_11215 [Verrucomicrobiota bacterium]